jgi:hypothetical protein
MSLPLLFIIVIIAGVVAVVIRNNAKSSRRGAPAQFVCSACMGTFPTTELRVLPWWNDQTADFVTTHRCPGCWPNALAETRAIVSADPLPEETTRKMVDFLRRHEFDGLADALTTPEETRGRLLEFLDRLERNVIVLSP